MLFGPCWVRLEAEALSVLFNIGGTSWAVMDPQPHDAAYYYFKHYLRYDHAISDVPQFVIVHM